MNEPHSVNEFLRFSPSLNSSSSSFKTKAGPDGAFASEAACDEHNSTPSVSRTKVDGMYKKQRMKGISTALSQGFPAAKMLGVFCLSTGGWLGHALSKWCSHDLSLWHRQTQPL